MHTIGKHNALTDVDGILVGHYTDTDAASGVTVTICPKGATTAVDVRGSAPGTRETDLLAPAKLVELAQAVVLSGGSVFGLAAADGVVAPLSRSVISGARATLCLFRCFAERDAKCLSYPLAVSRIGLQAVADVADLNFLRRLADSTSGVAKQCLLLVGAH